MKKKLKKKNAAPTVGANRALVGATAVALSFLPIAFLAGQANQSPSTEEVKITLNTCAAAKKSCGEMRDKLQETINLLPDPAPVASIKKVAPVKHVAKKKHRIVKKKHHRKHYAHKPCNCICMPRIFSR